MKLCLMGGTFDPPHWGHALLAEAIVDELHVEKFTFIPAYIPPHKQGNHITDSRHRLRMLELVVQENPVFDVDPREINREGVSYTIDTIREIKQEYQLQSDEIGFLIGADNFLALYSWKNADALVEECRILVAERPEYPVQNTIPLLDQVEFIPLPKIEISSSMIRDRIQRNQSVQFYVLPVVYDYIQTHKLYR